MDEFALKMFPSPLGVLGLTTRALDLYEAQMAY
ncbi:Uncharacterised protein [Mycobacterium tuberculosis]|nr:Uncharacterised protein [Mycobacterium tuberculosis]CMO85774.1 Uncharacterised protein [Mycobacterium tuberculosis]